MAMTLRSLDFTSRLPTIPSALPIFNLSAPDFEERKPTIARLAEHLKLGALRTVELDHARIMASERGDIHFFPASGGLWARDATVGQAAPNELRKWDGLVDTQVDGHRMALTPDAAKRVLGRADKLLRDLGLVGREVASQTLQLDQVAQLDAKGRQIDHGAGQATVKYQYAVEGLPIRGAGAKTLLFAEPGAGSGDEAGSEAESEARSEAGISGIFHAWRPISGAGKLAMTSLEEALGIGLLADPELEQYSIAGHRIQVSRLELVYLALPVFMRQTHLFPMFQVEGVVSEGPKGIRFHFGRFHHAATPRAYADAGAFASYLTANPDGISPRPQRPVIK